MSTRTTPQRSTDQRLAALRRANEIRGARSSLKAMMKILGRNQACEVFARVVQDPAPEFHTMKVTELLLAVPKFGRRKLNPTMLRLGLSHSKTLSGLSPRQRGELAEWAETFAR